VPLYLGAYLMKFALLVAIVLTTTGASAQSWQPLQIQKFDESTIQKAIQCELGHFAVSVRRQKLDHDHLLASVSISSKFQAGNGWGVSLPFFAPKEASDHGYDGSAKFLKPLNVDVANLGACPKKTQGLELLDLRQCLAEYAPGYLDSEVTCQSHMHVKRTVGFDGKATFFVTFDANASWDADYLQAAQVIAPAQKATH
jgi:hypothetical protein